MTRYIRLPELLAKVGVSWITISRWEKEGRFPARRRLGANSIGWVEAEVDKWLAERPTADSTTA